MSRPLDAALEAIDRVLDVGKQTDAGTDWALTVTDPHDDPPIRCSLWRGRTHITGHRVGLVVDTPPGIPVRLVGGPRGGETFVAMDPGPTLTFVARLEGPGGRYVKHHYELRQDPARLACIGVYVGTD